VEGAAAQLSEVLKEHDASGVWIAAIRTVASRRRLELPIELLSEMELGELKSVARRLRRCALAGPVDGPAQFKSKDELMTVLELAESKANVRSTKTAYAHSRTVVGRFHFGSEDLEDALDIEEDEDTAPEDQLLCFSDEINFWWPSPVLGGAGITLSAAVGCRRGMNVVDLCEDGSSGCSPDLSLKFRLQLVHPRFSKEVVLSGDSINVGGACACKHELLDIADKEIREILSSPEGVFCLLSLEEIPNAAVKSMAGPATRIKTETAGPVAMMNALALSASYAPEWAA
jgi:hypothetical protein